MRLEDEPDLYYIDPDGEERPHDIKEMLVLLGQELCSDEVYAERKSICDACEHLRKGEMCDVDRMMVRLDNRLLEKRCPLSKW